MEFNSIGFFQFDNLLQSRVPLMLVMLEEVELKSWYNSLVQMHIDNICVVCLPHQTLEIIQSKMLPTHYGIVILDKNGNKSPAVVTELEQAGFTNVYYVKGGFVGISLERSTEQK